METNKKETNMGNNDFQNTEHQIMDSDHRKMGKNEVSPKVALAYCLESVSKTWSREEEARPIQQIL